MADVQAFLTRKAGPLPVWGWAAIGGGLVSVLYLRGRSQASSATGDQSGDTSSGSPFATPIILARDSAPPSVASTTPAVPAQSTEMATNSTQVPIYLRVAANPAGVAALLMPGQSVPTAGPPVQGGSYNTPEGLQSTQWQPVKYAGATLYAPAVQVSVTSGPGAGMGGGAVQTMPGAGQVGRFASPLALPQYLPTGMGGGGPAGLHAVARRTGLPVARVMALNPGHWRGGRPPAAIHIR